MDLYELALAVKPSAAAFSARLRGDVSAEATRLIGEGFIVPAPAALAEAAGVFEAIEAMQGSRPAIKREDSPSQRIDLICALASALDGATREIGLGWSNAWLRALGERRAVIRAAGEVLSAWNAGRQSELIAQMQAAVDDHYAKEVLQR